MQLFIIAVFIFVFDQVTKYFVLHSLTPGQSLAVIPRIFHLTLVENQGIAFGMFQNHGSILQTAIILCVMILIIYFASVPQTDTFHRVCYGFILGGALGNLTDRIRFGRVTDFLDFRIWPVFNVADSFISIGVLLLIVATFRKPKTHVS